MTEFTLLQDGKTYHLVWELIHKDKRVERYRITPQANPKLEIILENNRPFIREVKKLKHKPIFWKQVGGETMRDKVLEAIIRKIEEKPVSNQAPPTLNGVLKSKKPKRGDGPGKPLGKRNNPKEK